MNDNIAKRQLRPQDCALVVGLPRNRDKFFREASERSPLQFAKWFVYGSPEPTLAGAWEKYEKQLGVVERVEHEVASRGVSIYSEGRYVDLCDAFQQGFPLVSVVAHWCFASLTREDILDADRFLIDLRSVLIEGEPDDRLAYALIREGVSAELRHRMIDTEHTAETENLLADVVAAINALLDETCQYYEASDIWMIRGATREELDEGHCMPTRLTRDALEDAFPSSIRPAPVLELRDGIWTVPALLDAIPSDYRGIVDLIVCHSSLLGHALKRHRRDILVRVNQGPQRVIVAMARYGCIVEKFAEQPDTLMGAFQRCIEPRKEK